jgi:hypothetical protein
MSRRRWYTLPISDTLVASEFWDARTIAVVYRAYLRALLIAVGASSRLGDDANPAF